MSEYMSAANFSSPFWSWFIIVLTVANILACWWLIRWSAKRRPGEAPVGEITGHTWDEDLHEYNNPMPRWWLGLFYITIVFALVYLVLYPGAGAFSGVLGWSKEKQYEQQMESAQQKYGPIFEQYAGKPIPALATNEDAVEIGRRLFLNHCSTCHGSDARGARGFPNLRDDAWLWGGEPQQIEQTILEGRQAQMPAWGESLSDAQIDNVVGYVQNLSGRPVEDDVIKAGRQVYQTYCIGCHGPNAKGNTAMGAPNLTDNNWLYGGSPGIIRQSIVAGRQGEMPPHKEFLGEAKVHLLATYVYSLSQEGQ